MNPMIMLSAVIMTASTERKTAVCFEVAPKARMTPNSRLRSFMMVYHEDAYSEGCDDDDEYGFHEAKARQASLRSASFRRPSGLYRHLPR